MVIRLATEHDAQAWDCYVLNQANGLAYHQFAWRRAVKDAYNFDSCYLMAEKNGNICGVLPFILFKRPFSARRYVSLPYCDVGGCLADDETIRVQLLQKAKELGVAEDVAAIELRTGPKHAQVEGEITPREKVRMVLELPNTSEAFLHSLKSKLRSQVKKPQRDGLTSCIGGGELVSDFYKVFAENMRELGSPVHSKKWIDSVVKNYAENARVGLVFTPDKELAAAGIILLHRDIISIPWASSLRRFNRLNPNMLLYWEFLKFAANNGYRYFDFGRSTPGEGTYKFKEQWGAKAMPLQWVDLLIDSGGELPPSNLKMRRLSEKVWSKLPVSLTTIIGPPVRRYISL